MGEIVESQTVGELTGTDPEKTLRFVVQGLIEFSQQVVDIDKKTEPGIVEIGLEDAIDAIHRTVHADIKHLVVAAAVLAGAGAGLEKGAPVAAKKQMSLTGAEVGRILPFDVRGATLADHGHR